MRSRDKVGACAAGVLVIWWGGHSVHGMLDSNAQITFAADTWRLPELVVKQFDESSTFLYMRVFYDD
jgi:hypothetical protein